MIIRNWSPTRDFAINRLNDFLPSAGGLYASDRNYDLGTEFNKASCLSPYISRRLITEDEVLKAILENYSYKDSEKFIQEILWRVYWKGWLELHPNVWSSYRKDCERLKGFNSLQYENALNGSSGIDCFDYWVSELISTGYLHNHARMWFASIWIFTLGLPWQLGAHFFYNNLLDADPASNTLSWRWVAGLQTKGKSYFATQENIKKFTKGRFNANGITSEEKEIVSNEVLSSVALESYPESINLSKSIKPCLIVFEEDLSPESLITFENLPKASTIFIISQTCIAASFGLDFSERVISFSDGAIRDLKSRISSHQFEVICPSSNYEMLDNLNSKGINESIFIRPATGYGSDLLTELATKSNCSFYQLRRRIDNELYPKATKGFFHFKKFIPSYLNDYVKD